MFDAHLPACADPLAKGAPFQADALLAAAIGVLTVSAWIAETNSPDVNLSQYREMNAVGIALLAAQIVPLAWKRRAPFTVLVIIAGATVAWYGANFPNFNGAVPALIAVYTCAAQLDRRYAVRTLAVAAVALTLSLAFSAIYRPFVPASLVSNVVLVAIAFIAGGLAELARAGPAGLAGLALAGRAGPGCSTAGAEAASIQCRYADQS